MAVAPRIGCWLIDVRANEFHASARRGVLEVIADAIRDRTDERPADITPVIADTTPTSTVLLRMTGSGSQEKGGADNITGEIQHKNPGLG